MSGALVDLVAQGVQDAYLTGNPEVSFFRQNYKRHTNFSYFPVKLNAIGQMVAGGEATYKIPVKGDLLSHMWLDLGSGHVWDVDGDTLNPTVFELWVGGQMVDRQDANYITYKWQKFLLDSGVKGWAYCAGANNTPNTRNNGCQNPLNAKVLPLHFFFCDEGAKLPLVALQYNEVEIRVKWSADATPGPSDFTLYAEYIVLDTAERDYFVNKDHELLIEQVQKLIPTDGNDTDFDFDLSLLNHPVKCLMWGAAASGYNEITPSDPLGDSIAFVNGDYRLPIYYPKTFDTGEVQIYLNGTSLFESPMKDRYFTYTQAMYHSEHGSMHNTSEQYLVGAAEDLKGNIYYPGSCSTNPQSQKMYSFALKANRHYPTGTCNFSRLDNAKMTVRGAVDSGGKDNIVLHAVNFNVLRIKKGQAGVAFSN